MTGAAFLLLLTGRVAGNPPNGNEIFVDLEYFVLVYACTDMNNLEMMLQFSILFFFKKPGRLPIELCVCFVNKEVSPDWLLNPMGGDGSARARAITVTSILF
jgi:hypothetical protein